MDTQVGWSQANAKRNRMYQYAHIVHNLKVLTVEHGVSVEHVLRICSPNKRAIKLCSAGGCLPNCGRRAGRRMCGGTVPSRWVELPVLGAISIG